MKKLRALVLMHESLVPPDSLTGFSEQEILEWKTEYDVVSSLQEIGHDVFPLGVCDDLGDIRRAIEGFKPHIAFNLLEEFHGVGVYDHHVVSYLELMQQHYTGCNPRGLLLAHDKPLAKKILAFHGIDTPGFFVAPMGKKTRIPAGHDFPLLVKSVSEDASLGITQASVVHNKKELLSRIDFVHEELKTDALVEAYIEGRELYVGVMGNRRLTTLPIWEMVFRKSSPGISHIASAEVKWDAEFQERVGADWLRAENLDATTERRIQKTCKKVYRALGLSGYARMDLRLSEDGKIYILEANPNPNMSFGDEFAESAESHGINYKSLLQKIINLGLSYQAEWRLVNAA